MDKHNGYTNYETWVINLWISNEEASYNYYRDLARNIYNKAWDTKYLSKYEEACRNLAHELEATYQSNMADILEKSGAENTVWSDLIGNALSNVNWHEIAGQLLDEFSQVEA